MRESISPSLINLHQELRRLTEASKWITQNQKLTPEAMTLIDQVEGFFKVQKKKTSIGLMGKEFSDNLNRYLELFPNIKLPSGKMARSDRRNLETNFRWFFENYQYGWEIILKATEIYVNEFQRKNWLYMRTSQYFIKKQEQDKSIMSELANYCAIVQSGSSGDIENHTFSDKVV
jgi:hypothetical protein